MLFDPFLLAVVQTASCLFMAGVIWVVQLVHYPAFPFVEKDQFTAFHNFHSARITWIVGPAMGVELVSAGLLCVAFLHSLLWWSNMAGVLLIWASTVFLSIPRHNALALGFSSAADTLVHTNWPRTIIWTVRSVVICLAWLKLVGSQGIGAGF